MLPLPRGAVWQTLFLLCAVLFINEVRSEGRVVCYYTNWSVYRPGTAKFNPQNINPYLCTHLVYAFGGFTKDNQMKPFDKYQDIEQGGYAKFTGLKTYNKQLKTMIAIGGWNEASSRFSPLMANPERRQQFIKNILKFLRQNHFDGIDLDWEYPAQREGGKQRDRDNYAQFVQELRAEFEREAQKTGRTRLLVTMAVPAGIENIEKGYDIPKLNKYLDWFNVLSYDFHSSHEPSANHHAPLYSLEEESEYNYDAELNIDYSIKYYLKAGADRDKLVLGIPTYGRSYTLINEESTEIGAPSEGPGEQGDATREKGYLAYYEICQNLKEDPEWTVVQPNPNAMGPYAYRRNQWVGYDDEAIVRKKAQYVVEHGLGGIMFWAIDNDDFRGTCTGKPYPLIEAAKEAMMESLGLGINEVAKPNSPKKPSRSRSRENSSSKLNRIGGSSEGKGAGRTTLSSGRRRVQASSTTTTTPVPETTIRLTNAEGSSLYIGGRVTTPAPPTTPDPGTDFKCEEEGFFQHPRDCKKYYWCLDSGPSGLGIVGHQFTCPSGLYFNPAADSCDFARNVPCKTKKSTTAAPVSSTTTTTTTSPRPTAALNRITAATSRTSFFRTTTTTSTTPAPIEYEEEEEEEVDDEAPAHTKDRDAEEDPQVIKELIELIRKVGGLEELEKHLLRKDDGTISIKGSASNEAGGATTPTPISKNLYDKVLSKPNTFNSFRNRFTSSSLFRKSSGQTSTEEPTSNKQDSGESQSSEGALNSGYSKYSSVVRGNSRQGPQNEGLDKLTEFDGFLKEKKQYVTINRHRGAFRGQDDEEEVEEKEEFEEEELSSRSKSTKRPTNTVTPSYASIRRTRPTTVRAESDEEIVSEEEVRTSKESDERRTYTSLNRNRARITATESSQAADETATNINRYKYLERTRPTNRIPTTSRGQEEEISLARNEEKQEDDDQNVTVQLNGATNDSKQNSTQTTTRIYANIGRRTTTTTETPITTTQETPTRYNLLENINYNNETPEPNLPTTITATSDSPTTLSITIKNTNPQIIPIQTTTTSDSTTSRTTTTSPSNNIELTDAISTITTLPPNFDESADSYEALDLSLDVNSLVEKSPKTASTTVEPQKSEVADATTPTTTTATRTTTKETLTSTATASGTGTGTATTTTATPTDPTDQNADANDEVTNLTINKRLRTQQQQQQQQQYKFITRTRNVTKATTTTTTNTDTDTINANENENETTSSNNKFTKDTLKKKTSLKTTGNRSSGGTSTDDKLSSNIRGNTVKYSGGRRQQQKQQQKQLNESLTTRKNLNHNQQLDSTKDSTNIITTTDSTPTNEFLGSISSPRPFGFPRRRTRPNSPTTSDTQTTTTTTESSSDDDEQSLVKTRLSASNAAKNKDNGSGDGERTLFTTPQTPTTTLLHVFTLTDDEQTNRPPIDNTTTIGRLVPEKARPKHKVVEINRIVEITSKENKLRRKSKANQEFIEPISSSLLRVESLPHLEQLGEISVVKFVHLVDGSDISIDGHSTVTDYTPTEHKAPVPVRNSLPEGVPYYVPQYAYSTESANVRTTLEQRNGKGLIPEVIRGAVETSTISLEGLFDGERQGKELNSINYPYYIFGSDETTTTSTTTVKANENENENDNETQNSLNTTPKTQTTTSSSLPTATTITADTTRTSTTTERALPPYLHNDIVNNIPNEISTNLESTTIVGNTIDGESTTQMPLINSNNTSTTIESTIVNQQNVTLDEYVNSNLVETTTVGAPAYTDETPSADTAVKSSAYVRTTTATTTIVTAIPVATTTQTRRPVVSVRRRKINSPNGSLGIAYQTATTSQQTSQTAAAGATTATATNTYASTIKSDELLAVTTATTTSVELTTTFNKQQQQQQQQQRYRNKLVTPAATATTTNTELTAPTTTTSSAQQFTAAAITLNNAVNNQKSYLTNTKYRLKLPATTLSTGDSSLATVTTNVEGAAATVPTTTASNDIIQQQQQQQQQQQSNANTKQPSTVLRRKFQTRRLITTTTVGPTDDSATELPRTPNPLFKRRFSLIPSATAITIISTSTPADGLTTTFFADGFDADDASDQVAKSSIHTSHFNQFIQKAEDNEQQVGQRTLSSGIKASSLKSKTNIETATTHAALEPNPPYVESITRRMGTVAATTEFTAAKRKSNDIKRRPQKYTPTTPQTPIENITARRGQPAREVVLNRRRPNKYAAGDTYDRLNGNQPAPVKTPTRVSNTYRPVVDYDYYDDENERIVGNTEGQQLKVILHGRGIIECLDQGNFPHPLSCRKFISCAKFETGGVVGWEYTCPKGLSYDPVGGMCNWAAGLGCKE